MTSAKKKRFQSRGSESHFLFSKTKTDRIEEIQTSECQDADDAIRSAFPDLLIGNDYIDFANQQLKKVDIFSALVIRRDQGNKIKDSSELPDDKTGHVAVADILNGLCRKKNGFWGSLGSGLLGCFFPEINDLEGLELAGEIQKRVKAKTTKTVTIGLASFPTITYKKAEILNNARKALDHATFFGANSLIAFDDVSLNISGNKFYEKGKILEAIHEFKLALELEANNVNVRNSLGVCYGLQSQYDAAIAQFQKAVAIDPAEYMALYNLGLIHLLMEQRDRALEYFLDADKINGNNYEVALQTGKLYLEGGDYEKCKPYLERAAELDPESGHVYRYLGDCYAAGHRPEAA